jgi:hypothetical protein
MGDVFVTMQAYRKFFPNCGWRAIMQSAGQAKDRSPATAPPLPEWRTTDGIYGEHRRCGTCHRRDQPCPRYASQEGAAGVGTG